ncbi:methyltransferase domain-containing protein [Synechococcales cyanobacterium C]|uniref:Methyltransferase domain-containing protein n=1 Tax=Petrachloros mirabilis ULC683 TaxID=2781853 RepID=A0A8K1ZYM0_9CYAN|nr:class I SAM-dependent methyltransferase [Petrachloros mirabilis]NCJ06496.1 methyltransferase domain-containing protein [Petrachloros mirabilis ULC683]
MSKKQPHQAHVSSPQASALGEQPDSWQPLLGAVAHRFNREYERQPFDLPTEVEAMPIFREWASGELQAKIASPFWQMVQPRKHQHWLDLGCGISLLIYPWRDWDAFFHGQEISRIAQEALNQRGPQLNSKIFKGVKLAPAHRLEYDPQTFDHVVATGVSCYYPVDYWQTVLAQVRRVLKPGGTFIFDVINLDAPLAENWAILETYLGAEVFLEPLETWQASFKQAGVTRIQSQTSPLFQMYQVNW